MNDDFIVNRKNNERYAAEHYEEDHFKGDLFVLTL